MPRELQLNLIGESAMPPTYRAEDVYRCVGGCDRLLARLELYSTDEGLMCAKCVADLYTVCNECNRFMRLNEWSQCEESQEGPDGIDRCQECHNRIYARCLHCGGFVRRENGGVCFDPNNSNAEFCARCWSMLWFYCDRCNEIFSRRILSTGLDGENFCTACFDVRYERCSSCNAIIRRGENYGWAEDPFCEDCFGHAETWKVRPWSGSANSFDRIGSNRRYGVELETARCDNYRQLQCQTEWGCVYECSTPGREFVSPILQGDDGLREIRKMCELAAGLNWTVDRSCGLHIHLDLSTDSPEECLRIAYAYRKTYPIWKKFAAPHRANNSMCGSPQYSCADIRAVEHIEDFVERRDRFEFVNWRAYLRHGSFEVRLYQGTLNAREICNWIILHARFMDAVKGMTFDEIDSHFGGISRKHWAGICALIDNINLLDYWRRKAQRNGYALACCWNPVENAAPEGDDEIIVTGDQTFVSDRAINAGEVDFVDITGNGRYPYAYDSNRQGFIVFTNDDAPQEEQHRPYAIERPPLRSLNDDDPIDTDWNNVSDIDDGPVNPDWINEDYIAGSDDEDDSPNPTPPIRQFDERWCEICRRYH